MNCKMTSNTDSPLALLRQITTAVLGGILMILLFFAFSIFVALENCPGGDGYNPNGSIKRTFTEVEKKLNEVNEKPLD